MSPAPAAMPAIAPESPSSPPLPPHYRVEVLDAHAHLFKVTLTIDQPAALQRVAILTNEKFRGVRLNIAPGALRVASSNAQQEEADEDIEVDYAGEPIEIGFNIGYLLDVLTQTDGDRVTLEVQNAHSTVLFTFPGRPDFQYVVSPMRL